MPSLWGISGLHHWRDRRLDVGVHKRGQTLGRQRPRGLDQEVPPPRLPDIPVHYPESVNVECLQCPARPDPESAGPGAAPAPARSGGRASPTGGGGKETPDRASSRKNEASRRRASPTGGGGRERPVTGRGWWPQKPHIANGSRTSRSRRRPSCNRHSRRWGSDMPRLLHRWRPKENEKPMQLQMPDLLRSWSKPAERDPTLTRTKVQQRLRFGRSAGGSQSLARRSISGVPSSVWPELRDKNTWKSTSVLIEFVTEGPGLYRATSSPSWCSCMISPKACAPRIAPSAKRDSRSKRPVSSQASAFADCRAHTGSTRGASMDGCLRGVAAMRTVRIMTSSRCVRCKT
mmetsp:Transcript_62122/g.202746  ORF Transcript_62122/g.202746 Transcript_62122/m.202746 type:complete len:346 (-) Transcript_62122:288-1325(-)